MLVLLFDIMEFGIVGGYLSKLCVTLPHMSIGAGVVVTIALQQIDSTPHAETGTEGNNEGLEDFDSRVKEFHSRFSFILKKLKTVRTHPKP